jgi:hypothetical protein
MLENGNYKISVVPGQPIGGFFGYEYQGVYPSDADAIVRTGMEILCMALTWTIRW